MVNNLNLPKAIYLYNEGAKGIKFKDLANFIKKNFGNIPVKVIRLKEEVVETKGLLFDPVKTKDSFDKIAFKDKNTCRIILTEKLLATFDEDKKLHIRAAIYSDPSIISTSGIVEGPAKPREYYQYKERFTKLGVWEMEEPNIKKKFKNRFIDYGDKHINEVLKGYLSQALFFYMTGEPFCAKKACRLFNAHWQEDLIYSQIKIGGFCQAHKKLLNTARKKIKIFLDK